MESLDAMRAKLHSEKNCGVCSMTKLKGLRAYLCGPIDDCPNGGRTWRMDMSTFLTSLDVTVLDPTNKPIDEFNEGEEFVEYRSKLKEEKNYDELSRLMRSISNVDLRMVDLSDFLIVNLDRNLYPAGTIHEMVLANSQKKPILIRMKQGVDSVPDWWFGRLNHNEFFDSWSDLKSYLNKINNGVISASKRWYFFEL
jgi:hypothetical protein